VTIITINNKRYKLYKYHFNKSGRLNLSSKCLHLYAVPEEGNYYKLDYHIPYIKLENIDTDFLCYKQEFLDALLEAGVIDIIGEKEVKSFTFKVCRFKNIDEIDAAPARNDIHYPHFPGYNLSMKLSDEQYITVLHKIRDTVFSKEFKPYYYDSTVIGDKYTESNCGLCNDKFYEDIDMHHFPEQFPERLSPKYRQDTHQCPFDWRDNASFNGCFHTCYLFKRVVSVKEMRKLVKKKFKKLGLDK
jgi:hypothetical protein